MIAAGTHNELELELESERHMQAPLVYSVMLHAFLIVFAVVGLPYITPELPDVVDPITVELLPVDEKTQTDKPPPPVPSRQVKPKQDSEEPPKPVMPQMTAKTPPKPVPPRPPAPEKKDTRPPEETPAPPEVKPEPAKAATPPKPQKRPMPPAKAEEAKQEEFNSLLRNLMPTEQERVVQPDKPGEGQPSSMLTRFSEKMSMSEMDALKQQLNQCWSVMAGARYAEDLIVDLKLFMNPDRSVRDVQIINVMRYNSDNFFRAAADAARRAVFRCSPLNVPPNKYDLWKEIDVRFDPRKML